MFQQETENMGELFSTVVNSFPLLSSMSAGCHDTSHPHIFYAARSQINTDFRTFPLPYAWLTSE